MSEAQNQSGGRTYPLSAIFAVTAVCAVLFGMLRSIGSQNAIAVPMIVAGSIVVGVLFGAINGVAIGAYHRRWGIGMLLGAVAGGCAGGITVPLVLAPAGSLAELWVTMLIGSALLVIAGLVMRSTSATDPPTPYLAGWQPGIDAELAHRDLKGEPPYLAGWRPTVALLDGRGDDRSES